MADPISSVLLASAMGKVVEVGLGKILSKSWGKEFDESKNILQELSEKTVFNNYLRQYVEPTLKIRTLLNPNKDLLLNDLYYPLSLKNESNHDIVYVKDGELMSTSKTINIVGIAGQGKSTILRKIFYENLQAGVRFPFFIELRRVEDGDIMNHLKDMFKRLQITIFDDNVEMFLQSEKVVLLLDGFDEVKQENQKAILKSIDSLRYDYKCPLIISSRPNTEICTKTDINIMKVLDIDLEDKIRILKILDDIDMLSNNGHTFRYVSDLLITNKSLEQTVRNPIMVTLLYNCFPYMDEIPKDTTDFYRQLFGVLYARHDKIKGLDREKLSGLGVEEARIIFSKVCYWSLISEQYELSSDKLHNYVTGALREEGLISTTKPADFIDDLQNVTCLLQDEGDQRYVFLHKSVQEYFAADAISKMDQPDEKLKRYDILRRRMQGSEAFDNLLYFLRILDRKYFTREILLGAFEKSGLLQYVNLEPDEFSVHFDLKLSKQRVLGWSISGEDLVSLDYNSRLMSAFDISFLDVCIGNSRTKGMYYEKIFEKTFGKKMATEDFIKHFDPSINMASDIISEDTKTHIASAVQYSIPLVKYLKHNDIYVLIRNGILRDIKTYFLTVYKPENQKAAEMLKARNENNFFE